MTSSVLEVSDRNESQIYVRFRSVSLVEYFRTYVMFLYNNLLYQFLIKNQHINGNKLMRISMISVCFLYIVMYMLSVQFGAVFRFVKRFSAVFRFVKAICCSICVVADDKPKISCTFSTILADFLQKQKKKILLFLTRYRGDLRHSREEPSLSSTFFGFCMNYYRLMSWTLLFTAFKTLDTKTF